MGSTQIVPEPNGTTVSQITQVKMDSPPPNIVATRFVAIEKKQFTAVERVTGVICCFPCITWSFVIRVICLPYDCLVGHPCGGNGCTKLCDEACLMPLIFGTTYNGVNSHI